MKKKPTNEMKMQPCIFSLESWPYNNLWSTGRLKMECFKVLGVYTPFKMGYHVYFINWSVNVLAFWWLELQVPAAQVV
jgi:hypothetical protein